MCLLLLLIASELTLAERIGHTFVFLPSNEISFRGNWLNRDRPCQDDHVVFEEEKKTVAMIDQSMQISQMLLPEDGAIYFDNDVILGAKPKDQCSRRKSPEEVFFEPSPYYGSVFNPANWDPDFTPLLHMNMVPGGDDYALFMHFSCQMFIDDQMKLSSMKMGGREMTTESLSVMFSSMEGQYKLSLGHRLSSPADIDGIEFILSNKAPVLIEPKTFTERERMRGVMNPNMKNETLSLICEYVKCFPVTKCTEPIRPAGHCCDLCGATIDFAGINTNQDQVNDDAWQALVHEGLSEVIWMSVERTDDDETAARYQIALLSTNDSLVEHPYDENVFKAGVVAIEKKLRQRTENAIQVMSFDYKVSKVDMSYAKISKVLGSTTFLFVMLVVITTVMWNDQPTRRRLENVWNAAPSSMFAIRWNRLQEDEITIVNPNHPIEEEMEPKSEEEAPKESLVVGTLASIQEKPEEKKSQNQQPNEEMSLIEF